MNYETLTKHILHELKITNKHIAYNYIASGIYFMQLDRQCIEHITKSMYIDIAERYGTTSKQLSSFTGKNIWGRIFDL